MSIGSIEGKFHDELVEKLGLQADDLPDRNERSAWPAHKAKLAELFRQKTRDEWCEIMEGTDICFAPVLDMSEAPRHPHMKARGTFIEVDGVTQPGPAPRFSRTPGEVQGPPAALGEHTREALRDWGFTDDDLGILAKAGAIRAD